MKLIRVLGGVRCIVWTWGEGNDCPVGKWLVDELPKNEAKRIVAQLRSAADTWPDALCNPEKCRKLKAHQNLYEFKAHHWRILFFLDDEGDIVLTNYFYKRGKSPPPTEIERALRLRDLLLGTTEDVR